MLHVGFCFFSPNGSNYRHDNSEVIPSAVLYVREISKKHYQRHHQIYNETRYSDTELFKHCVLLLAREREKEVETRENSYSPFEMN